jgi:hypothetical protein
MIVNKYKKDPGKLTAPEHDPEKGSWFSEKIMLKQKETTTRSSQPAAERTRTIARQWFGRIMATKADVVIIVGAAGGVLGPSWQGRHEKIGSSAARV